MAVIRKTYGYGKKTDDIGLSQLAEMTGIAKPHVSVTVRELAARRILTREEGKFGHQLGINKNHRSWLSVTDSVTLTNPKKGAARVTETVTTASEDQTPWVTDSVTHETLDEGSQTSNPGVTDSATGTVTDSVQNPVTDSVTTKENPPKDNHQKTTTKNFPRSLRERFDIFWAAYPRKEEKKDARALFEKLNPDDDLLAQILRAVETAKKSQQWKVRRFIKQPPVWLRGECWTDELTVEFTPEQIEVIAAYNAALGESIGEIDPAMFVEERAGAIDDFLSFRPQDPTFWQRYFPWVAQKVDVPPRCGFDYLISREGFSKVSGGQHMKGEQ